MSCRKIPYSEKQNELRSASLALVEYIRKYGSPATMILVTGEGVKVLVTTQSTPYNHLIEK